MINGMPGLSPTNIRIGSIEVHHYDRENPVAAKISSYDKNDPELLKQVMETRALVQQSFFEEIKLSEVGLKINSLTTAIPHKVIREEASKLKSMIDQQLGYLNIPREDTFHLYQDDKGNIVVDARVSNDKTDEIADKLNSSAHFKETFHLLSTAEKVLGGNYKTIDDKVNFKLIVSPEGISSKVSLEKGAGAKEGVTDLEMYHLARYGIAAQKTQTVYLGHVANHLYKK